MKTQTLELKMELEVDENAVEELKKLEHHIDYLLDLDNFPEIKTVRNVAVRKHSTANE
ncbi:MAG: hypothetical protein ACLUCI_03865 [Blautia hansenii]|jgi:hypothetical protein